MQFRVDPKIFSDFEEPVIGVIVARGINNKNEDPEIQKLLRDEENNLRQKLEGVEIPTHSNIAPWRETYRKFGSKPNDFRCSIEALTRIVLKGVEIRKINTLVDLYNFISIKYLVPVGAEDLDKMQGDLELTLAKGDEDYTALGSEENDPPKVGEVVYKDDLGIICRRWNWREGNRTKITPETRNAIVVIESIAGISIKEAVEELTDLIKKHCGGEISVHFLDKDFQEINIKET